MRKILSAALALAMTLSLLPAALAAPASGTAYASTQSVEVDGKAVTFQAYALKDASGNDTNYVKLRDVAHVLNGTSAQFSVGWDGAINIIPGQSYTDTGSEMTTPYSGNRSYTISTAETRINGAAASLEAIELKDDNGGAYTYYKLRDLGAALGFTVDWSAQRGIFIETGGTAQPSTPATPSSGTGTRTDPLPCDGKTVFPHQNWSWNPVQQIKLACIGELSGADANALAKATNGFNQEPNANQEWRFYEFEITYISSSAGDDDPLSGAIIGTNNFFTRSGSGITVYDTAALAKYYNGYGVRNIQLYPGASGKGVIGILTDKGLGDLMLRVYSDAQESATWILLNPGTPGIFAEHSSGGSSTTTQPSDPDTSTKPGSGTAVDKNAVYADYPSVPDFGAVFGVEPSSVEEHGDSVTYIYDATDVFSSAVTSDLLTRVHTSIIEDDYTELLEQHGFTQMSQKPFGATTYGNFYFYTNAPGGSINGSLTYDMSVTFSCSTYYLNGAYGMFMVSVKTYNR